VNESDLMKREFWESWFDYYIDEVKRLYEVGGINYDIPQEAQITSSIYSYVKNDLLVEFESDLYYADTKKIKKKIDLRVIGKQNDVLIEVKRGTGIIEWINDFGDVRGIGRKSKGYLELCKGDIDGLDTKGVLLHNIKNPHKVFLSILYLNRESTENVKNYGLFLEKLNEYANKNGFSKLAINGVRTVTVNQGWSCKKNSDVDVCLDVWVKRSV